jgi:hypothetical protein
MKWLFDTNACIRYLNGRSPELRAKVSAAGDAAIVVCSVVKAELFFGAARSTDPAKPSPSSSTFCRGSFRCPLTMRQQVPMERFGDISRTSVK